jgi:hypothetical protein
MWKRMTCIVGETQKYLQMPAHHRFSLIEPFGGLKQCSQVVDDIAT